MHTDPLYQPLIAKRQVQRHRQAKQSQHLNSVRPPLAIGRSFGRAVRDIHFWSRKMKQYGEYWLLRSTKDDGRPFTPWRILIPVHSAFPYKNYIGACFRIVHIANSSCSTSLSFIPERLQFPFLSSDRITKQSSSQTSQSSHSK